MDTKSFLDAVLPFGGRRCVGVINNGQFANYFGKSNEWAAAAIDRIDTHGADAYFGCASFKADTKSRKQDNVEAVRAFWLDVDTQESKPNERYADRKEALAQLLDFTRAIGWPQPYVVSSGFGLHAYWPTDLDMSPEAWRTTAELLKQATKDWNLAADHSRTSDSASVLRPVGSHNHKQDTPRKVKLLLTGTTTEHAILHMALEKFTGVEEGLLEGDAPDYLQADNTDLMNKVEHPPASAAKAATRCAVLAEMRDTHGRNQSEPLWHSVLGVLVNATDGEALAHEWSSGHPDYNRRETQRRLDRLRAYGPTRCEKISDFSPLCAGCAFKGRVSTPLTLGAEEAAPEPTVAVDTETGTRSVVEHPSLPPGYSFGRGGLVREETKQVVGETGEIIEEKQEVFVNDILLYPVNRVRASDKAHSMNVRAFANNGQQQEFLLDNGLVTSADKGLWTELGRREVGVTGKNRNEVQRYLNSWISKLREEYATTPCIEQYGWHEDGFVVGNAYLTAAGNRKAVLNASAARFDDYFKTAGELAPWVEAVDRAYNHAGQEALQFCVLVSFAAPLWQLYGENGGVTVYAHSAGSGYGKTTAQQVGLSAWGYHPELVLRESNFTEGALYQHIGVMKNLPVIIDEMTNCHNDFASKLVYNMSAGKGKSRLTSDAVMKKPLNWSTIAAASGNNLLTEKLSLHRANAEAEMARVFEFTLTRKGELDPNEALKLFSTFTQHYGHAGRAFMEHVVKNREEVRQLLLRMREMFNTKHCIQQSERYWSALHACVLTALALTKQLGLLSFDASKLEAWIGHELALSRSQMQGSVSDPLEQFGDMLSEIWNGVLVTVGEGNLAQGVHATVVGHPRNSITGRSILPDQTSAEKLFISTGAAKGWCNKHGVSFKEMHEALVNAAWADTQVKRISLGKGTEQYSGLGGPVKCWDINPSAVRAVMGAKPVAQKVLGIITGSGDGSGSLDAGRL